MSELQVPAAQAFEVFGSLGSVDISLQWRYVEYQTITGTVGQDFRFLAWLHWRVRRPGSGLPAFCRGCLMDQPLWGPVATAAGRIRELEHRLQTIRPLD